MANEITMDQDTFKNAKITKIAGPFILGEGPHWDETKKELLFVDIMGKTAHRYNVDSKEHKQIQLDEQVGLIIPLKGTENQYIISQGQKLVILNWDGSNQHTTKVLKTILSKEEEKTGTVEKTRINDGKADIHGNIWFGTMGKEVEGSDIVQGAGSFYRLCNDGKIETYATGVTISNGLGWNQNKTCMYYIDSYERRVDIFDFDSKTGKASNRREFFDFKKNNVSGFPDGMTTDSEDNLWVACWEGSQVIRVCGKTGKLIGSLKLPAEQITSVIFGNDNLDTLYVTSASYKLTEEKRKNLPYAGCLFAVSGLGVKGVSSNSAVLPLL